MTDKCNCWEAVACNQTASNGNKCEVTRESHFSGINNGTASGRVCWSIAGTMGDGTCSYLQEVTNCFECQFFHTVHREEIRSGKFVMSVKGS